MTNELILLTAPNREALYLNGSIFDEDDVISKKLLVRYMKQFNTLNVRFIELNTKGREWVNKMGFLPNYFHEIPKEFIDAYQSDLLKGKK